MGAGGQNKGTKSCPSAAPTWKCEDQQDCSTLIKVLLLLDVGFVSGMGLQKIAFWRAGEVSSQEREGETFLRRWWVNS